MEKTMLMAVMAIVGVTATAPVKAQQFSWPTLRAADNCYENGQQQYRGNRGYKGEIGRAKGEANRRAAQERATQKRAYYGSEKNRGYAGNVRYPSVQVNGRALQNSAPAVQVGGHTFVPMRSIFEALGATVTYDNQNRIARAERGGRSLQLPLPGNADVRYGGNLNSLAPSGQPFVRDGVTMVPLRMVSEKMGARVTYTPHATTPQISIRD